MDYSTARWMNVRKDEDVWKAAAAAAGRQSDIGAPGVGELLPHLTFGLPSRHRSAEQHYKKSAN